MTTTATADVRNHLEPTTPTARPPGPSNTTADSGPAAVAGAIRPAKVSRALLVVVLAALLMVVVWVEAPAALSTVTSAVQDAVGADAGWLVGALAAAVASMMAFAVLRARSLRAAGGRVSLAEATAVSYAAGAIHLTAPAGTVVSTGYAFRRLQRDGVKPAAITYSLAVSGLVCSLSLATIAVAGFLVNGSTTGWTTILAGSAGAAALAAATFWAIRRPESVGRAAQALLRRVNRLLRRPPDAGLITLQATIEDLRQVRPTGRDWAAMTGAATANWLLDLGCLWACAHAVGVSVSPLLLLTSYAVAMAGGGASPLPGGIGVVDGVLVLGLTSAGAPLTAALGAVLLYRVLSNGSVIIGGWTTVAARAARPGRRRPAAAAPSGQGQPAVTG